jgi:ABC-type transport system involved in multi-copper enzyme maturation permease subunit
VPAYVGGVSLVCIIVILNIVLVMSGVVQERKDKVLLFVLSLPVSPRQYVAAKIASNAIAFVGSWLILTAAAVAVIDASSLPNGILPFLLAVLTYLFFYYCVLLAVAVISESSAWHGTVITAGNISINFLIPLLLGLPSISSHRSGATAVWTADIVTLIVLEAAAGVVAVLAAYHLRSRAADFV